MGRIDTSMRRIMRTLVLISMLTACDDITRLSSGTWELDQWTHRGDTELEIEIVDPVPQLTLVVDVDAGTVTLEPSNEAPIEMEFVPRDRAAWPMMCPTNFTSSRVEVVDLDVPHLDVEGRRLEMPFLMPECRDGDGLFLGEGPVGSLGGGACGLTNGDCLEFR